MTDIYTLTQTALNTLTGVPSGMDIQLSTLPDLYIVWDLITGAPAQHAGDVETERFYRVQVNIYTIGDFDSLPNVDGAMIAAGFARGGERPLPYTQDSRHHGLAKDYTILINQ